MTPVGAYLKKLLYQYDCVVVPELGGFLTHYQSASYSEATGQYLPPRKRLAFNEALRLDDGVLTNFMMLHENLTREEALRKIGAFVAELRKQVGGIPFQQAGCFAIEGIGLFTSNDEGRLQFDPELRHNFFGEAYGMAPVSADRLTSTTVYSLEEPIEVEAVPVMALGPVIGEDVLEETPFVEVHRPQRIYLRWAAAAIVVGALGTLSYFSVIKPGQPLQSGMSPSSFNLATITHIPEAITNAWHNLAQPSTVTKPSGDQPAISSPLATPISEPVVLNKTGGNGAPVQQAQPEINPEATVEPKAAKSGSLPEKKVVEAPIAPTNEPRRNEAAAVAVEEAPAVRTHEGPLFIVIAGSFANKDNALRFRRRLRKAGYDDAYIILPNESTRLYKVAAVGFPKRIEAVESLDSLNHLTGIPAFIIRY